MSKEKVEVNGEKCFEMKGEIKGSDIVGMMESGMADSLGSEIDEDVIKDLELPCTIAVYEDDILPAKISFDMQDIMEKAMEEEGVDVSACSIEVTYHEYDSVGEIKVPNDVIEKAGGEVSDDKEDKEDKDDDKKADKPETVKIIRMSDVELTPVEWLWKPYLPFGKLSVLQGNPGEGKTYFAMHLAAACTNGKLLPNMERMEPFNVIYQTAEDGLGDTVKPRLIEAGADLDRVLVIDDSDVQLTLSDERIEKAIIENNARLVIIDPIQAYLGADVDMNRANEVRPIFMRLGQVAQRTGCAILLIGHLNKAAGMQSLQRGLGSIDIAAAVRSVMFIGKLKHDPTMRILTHEKSSLAPPGASLAFSLGDEGGFRWVGEYDITADEMLSGIEPQRETKTQQAKDLICALLAGGKQALSEDIDKAALERGIPGRTVRDAKRELGDALKSKIVEGRKKVFGWNKPFGWQKILAGKNFMVHPQLPVCQPNWENDDKRRNRMENQNSSYSVQIGKTTFIVCVKQSETAKKPIEKMFKDMCKHEVTRDFLADNLMNLEKLPKTS